MWNVIFLLRDAQCIVNTLLLARLWMWYKPIWRTFLWELSFRKRKHKFTETERSSGWQSWSSLETLKPSFNVPIDDQGSQLDDISVSVLMVNTIPLHGTDRTLAIMQPILSHFPWIKWSSFRRRCFQMHFHEWKVLCIDSNFTEVCS